MSGLIVVLATDHPMGDFGFLRYKWTQSEQLAYSQSGISPKTVNDLPAYTPIIPIYYYVKDLGCDFRGPNLTAPQYRRLNSCRDHRLIIWNLWGPDEVNRQCPLVAIPSEDLCPTQEQRALFLRNLDMENNSGKFAERTPLISSLLNTGLLAADYTIYSQGPLNYHGDGADWSEVWKFFERFTQQSQLQHPRNCIRNSALYRHTLCKLNTRLVQEYMLTKAI